MDTLRNENGFSVLLLCLMVLLVMTALGSAMLMTSQREIKSVNKLKLSTQAFYSAESGISIAITELNNRNWADFTAMVSDLDIGLLPSEPLRLCSGDVDCDNNYGLDMNFDTIVKLVGGDSDPLCYGDIDGDFDYEQHTCSEFREAYTNGIATHSLVAGKDYWPILKITSKGWDGNNQNDLFKYAQRIVQVQVRLIPSFTFPQAALTLNQNFSSTSTNDNNSNVNVQNIIGEGYPGNANLCGIADIVGTNNSVNSFTGGTGICEIDGEQVACEEDRDIVDDAAAYPVEKVIALLRPRATVVELNNQGADISDGNHNGIYYHEGNAEVGGTGLKGEGILIVNGDLTLNGNSEWNGMILVSGTFRTNGGGQNSNYIHGFVIAGGDVVLKGNPDIYFDCAFVLELWESTGLYHQLWWREIKGKKDINTL